MLTTLLMQIADTDTTVVAILQKSKWLCSNVKFLKLGNPRRDRQDNLLKVN
jgi:hypothetical protein